jgi:hypothetical protein
MTLMSSMAMGFMGILPDSAQSLIFGNAQYHRPFNLHLSGAMSLHLTCAAVALITKLIGLTNTFVPLRIAGIALIQLVWVLGSTSVAWHLVTYTVAPLQVTCLMSPPEHLHETVGVLRPGDALQPHVWGSLHILASYLTCKKLSSDSNLVNSASVVTMLNLRDATSICSMGWQNTAMFLMCVVCAARPHSIMVCRKGYFLLPFNE